MRISHLIGCIFSGIALLCLIGVRHNPVSITFTPSMPNIEKCDSESEKILYLYNWAEYIPSVLIEKFKKETGIEIVYSVFDSVETLESQLLLDTPYDVVFPPAWPVLMRGIETKRFMVLNKKWIPNINNLDASFMEKLGHSDSDDLLLLKLFKTPIQYTFLGPAVHTGINGMPVAKMLG